MKKLLVIFLVLSILNANTALGEILKFPVLIHHYVEHTQEDQEVCLIDFFAQHYTKTIEHQHQNSHAGHEKLPFKTTDGSFSTIVTLGPPPPVVILNHNIIHADLIIPDFHQQFYGNAYLNSIWQPPRFS